MSPVPKIAAAAPAPVNDNDDPFALDMTELGVAAQSAIWHTRTYADLLRPRLRALAEDPAQRSRALAGLLQECIGCRRATRCEFCPVARAARRI